MDAIQSTFKDLVEGFPTDYVNLLRGLFYKSIHFDRTVIDNLIFEPTKRREFRVISSESRMSVDITVSHIQQLIYLFNTQHPSVFRTIELERYCEIITEKVSAFTVGLFFAGLHKKLEDEKGSNIEGHYFIGESEDGYFPTIIGEIFLEISTDEIPVLLQKFIDLNGIKKTK